MPSRALLRTELTFYNISIVASVAAAARKSSFAARF